MTLSSPAGPKCPDQCHLDPHLYRGLSLLWPRSLTEAQPGVFNMCLSPVALCLSRLLGPGVLDFDYVIFRDPASPKLLGESVPYQLHLLLLLA